MDNPNVTFMDKLRYRFDNTMSAGSVALIKWLGIVSLLAVMLAGAVTTYFGITEENEEADFFQLFWKSLMRTLDAGNLANEESWGPRIAMLCVTIFGIFIVSTLIGILTSAIESKLEELRKGRSFVIEKDHTLILGWSSKIFSIVSELIVANANRKNAVIVILADKDKVEMEEELRSKIPDTRNTRIICRTGLSIDMDDLNIVNPNAARSIVILSPEGEMADAHVIKSILAIVNNPNRKSGRYHIVAEIKDPENHHVAEMVGKDELCILLSDDLISRITVQTCRHTGLSVVYSELLDFEGVEIYFQAEPQLTGKTYRDAVMGYENSSVMGIKRADGSTLLNPPGATKIEAGDQVIAISEDDDTVRLSGKFSPEIQTSAIVPGMKIEKKVERTLILGWNPKAPSIIVNLDDYVAPGSEITVVAHSEKYAEEVEALKSQVRNQTLAFKKGETSDRGVLDSLDIANYRNVILLCYADLENPQEADSITLITLLHLRDKIDRGGASFNIVSEMFDIRNRELAMVTKVNDFIVSDKLTSLMLAQLSENKALKAVYDDLFDAEGNEIYLKPVTHYIRPDEPVNFYTIMESALQKNETAIGYRLHAYQNESAKAYGIVVNPKKSEMIRFDPKDKIIVVAED